MGKTIHSGSNTRTRSPDVVRGIVTAMFLSVSLCHSAGARAIEPRPIPIPIPIELEPEEEKTSETIIETGVGATMLFATIGFGMGILATSIDAESERRRDNPCRSCPGGFNDMQQDMAMIANGSLLSFLASGIIGAVTTAYAAATEEERIEPSKRKKDVKIRASTGGFVISF